MIEMSSTKARENFGAFLDLGSKEIVIVKRQNREVGAFIPMEELQKLKRLRRQELDLAARAASGEAQGNDLTAALLEEILREVHPG